MAMDFRQEKDSKNVVNDSLEFFVNLVKLFTTSPKRSKAEKTSLKVIELAKNGFVVPAKIRTLTASGFPEAFDKLAEKADEYANSVSEFAGAELIDDKNYRVREASILSFLILTDAMKSLKIAEKLDNPINKLTLREYLHIFNSQLPLLNAELKDILRFAKMICGDACNNLSVEDLRYGLVPLLLMGLSSEISLNDEGKKRKYMTTGLGLFILNFLKSHNAYTLDKASYRELIRNLNNIFDLHKYIVKNISDLINEAPMSIYSRYYGDRSYTPGFLELDMASFMLSIAYQHNEMSNKISPKYLADFPRLNLNYILNRIILA
jgi:hypothetical protein